MKDNSLFGALLRRDKQYVLDGNVNQIRYESIPEHLKVPFLLKNLDIKGRDTEIIENYLNGSTLQKIAAKLDVSYSRVQRVVSKIKPYISSLYLHNYDQIILQSQYNKILIQKLIKQILDNDVYDGEFKKNKKGQWKVFKPSSTNPHWTSEVIVDKDGVVKKTTWVRNYKLLDRILKRGELVIHPESERTIKAMQDHQYNQAMIDLAKNSVSSFLEDSLAENPTLVEVLKNVLNKAEFEKKLKLVKGE